MKYDFTSGGFIVGWLYNFTYILIKNLGYYHIYIIELIYMDVGGLPLIPTSSFWQFSSLAIVS
jgi:hypothetical protein